jgi:hypothetical protein
LSAQVKLNAAFAERQLPASLNQLQTNAHRIEKQLDLRARF